MATSTRARRRTERTGATSLYLDDEIQKALERLIKRGVGVNRSDAIRNLIMAADKAGRGTREQRIRKLVQELNVLVA